MIDWGIIITGGIGILTTVASGWTSWFFARKKYNNEVEAMRVTNTMTIEDNYKKEIEHCNERINLYIEKTKENEAEIYRLKESIYRLLNSACLDGKCLKRIMYSPEDIKKILGVTEEE